MNFSGFALRNYRSIGKEWVEINPLKKINILIGKNNSGKSNIIRGIQFLKKVKHVNNVITLDLDGVEFHEYSSGNQFGCKFYSKGLPVGGGFKPIEQNVFFTYSRQIETKKLNITDYFLSDMKPAKINEFYSSYNKSGHDRGINDANRKAFIESESRNFHHQIEGSLPEIQIIPEFRRMVEGGSRDEFNGNYLVTRLGEMKSPIEGMHAEKIKFLEIQQMIRDLLHNDEIELDIIHSGTPKLMIEDKSRDLRLPIESYGTGLHELVILSAATKIFSNCVFCIEEPEIHMHPGLQKEFVKFINDDKSENIYIISTHSNAFIDTIKDPMIFHVRLVNGDTVVNTVKNTTDTLHAIHDLGVKASDILQTNGIIWVEGPSDQIYINKWLELLEPSLEEGRDYLIMFYGGKLLNYLSLDDSIAEYTELNEFIELLRINQNSYIVMDRDRNNAKEYKGASKKRIINECKNSDLGYWLTEEREIENYISLRIFRNLIKDKYDGKLTLRFPPFKKLEKINYKPNNGKAKLLDYAGRKPHYARLIVKYFDAEMFVEKPTLKNEIDKIISSIKKWNEITG